VKGGRGSIPANEIRNWYFMDFLLTADSRRRMQTSRDFVSLAREKLGRRVRPFYICQVMPA
jgi:hypothetical protein